MKTQIIILFSLFSFLACEQDQLVAPDAPSIELRTEEDDSISACLPQPFGKCRYLDAEVANLNGFTIGDIAVPPFYLVRMQNSSDFPILSWTMDDEPIEPITTDVSHNIGFRFAESGTYRLCATFDCGGKDGFVCCEDVEVR